MIAILVLHLLIAAVGGLYLLNRTPRFKELADPGLPPPQPPPVRQTVGPAITIPAPPRPSSDSYLVSANVLRKPRRVASGNCVPSLDLPLFIYVTSRHYLRSIGGRLPPTLPETISRASGAPPTTIILPDAPDALGFSTPVVSLSNGRIAAPGKRASEGMIKLKPVAGHPPRRTLHASTCRRCSGRLGEGG